jgi:hypothetical protein
MDDTVCKSVNKMHGAQFGERLTVYRSFFHQRAGEEHPTTLDRTREELCLEWVEVEGRWGNSRGGQTDYFRPLTYTLGGGGHGVQGQICDILTQASYTVRTG